MRRLSGIAAFAACLLISPAWAQMRGGRMAAPPARSGFSAPARVFITQPHVNNFRPGFRPVFRPGFSPRFRSRRFFSAGWWPGSYGYGYYGAYWYPNDYSFYDNSQEAYYQQNQQLEGEVARLSDEVERLRDEQEQARYAPPTPPLPPQPPRAEKSAPAEPTTLIFRDGQRQQVENYAIAGKTLWIFNEQRARKRPLSDLDLSATQQANEDAGVEFRVPKQ